MCDPATAGLILTAVSGGTSFVNNQAALGRQDRQAAEGIRRQGRISSEASGRVNQQIEDVAGATGESEKAEALTGFLNALRTSQSDTEGALQPVAGANQRFAERVSGGKTSVAREGASKADRLSRIDAPIRLRQGENDAFRATASDLGEFQRRSSAEDFLTRLRVAGERPNAFIEALSGIGQGVGSVLALRPTKSILGAGTKSGAGTKIFN